MDRNPLEHEAGAGTLLPCLRDGGKIQVQFQQAFGWFWECEVCRVGRGYIDSMDEAIADANRRPSPESAAPAPSAHGLKPVAWVNKDHTYVELSTKSTVYGSHTRPLVLLSDVDALLAAPRGEAREWDAESIGGAPSGAYIMDRTGTGKHYVWPPADITTIHELWPDKGGIAFGPIPQPEARS